MKKGTTFFNIIIIITAIALVSVIGYVIYYYVSNYIALKQAEEAVAKFENEVLVVAIEDEQENMQNEETNQQQNPTANQTQNTNKTNSRVSYKGYSMIGTIQIPKTNVKIPIVDTITPQSITSAAAVLYGPGLNKIGNTVIVAHNYRNGTYFSNNKKLVVGDKIYVTDVTGKKVEYSVTKTYITGDMDFSYATRNTNGKREISLSTCTTDASKRLVIWAKEI